MNLNDFSYDLPEALIAKYPLPKRSSSRLLQLDRQTGAVSHGLFTQFPQLLKPEDLLIFNDTKVMHARLQAKKISGGKVSLLVERLLSATEALIHIKSNKRLRLPCSLCVHDSVDIEIVAKQDDLYRAVISGPIDFALLMERYGEVPLPPYIKRSLCDQDLQRYQTCYAKNLGAVAAPTAGLHFDQDIIAHINGRGIDTAHITLHVGAGTFQPVRTELLDDHVMHSERVEVSKQVCDQVLACKQRGGRVIAVGTTVVRSLEAAAQAGQIAPFCGDTKLFIRPSYRFRCVDGVLTNFHLPCSTLLMLICAFVGYEPVMNAYKEAVAEKYRFFSYGDAMFIA